MKVFFSQKKTTTDKCVHCIPVFDVTDWPDGSLRRCLAIPAEPWGELCPDNGTNSDEGWTLRSEDMETQRGRWRVGALTQNTTRRQTQKPQSADPGGESMGSDWFII